MELPNLKSVFNPVDLLVLSGASLAAFFKFLVGNSVFLASLKLRIALPTYPPPTPTKNPRPPAVNATVPVLTGSNVSLNPISFSTV